MAAANTVDDVLEFLQGEVKEEPEFFDKFFLTKSNFKDLFQVWTMYVSHDNEFNNDILRFAKNNKNKFVNEVEKGIKKLNNVKITYGLEVTFSRENELGQKTTVNHFFSDKIPYILYKTDKKENVEQTFDDFIEKINGEIENWSKKGSGWVVERVMTAYVNIAQYNPLSAGTFLEVPKELKNKNAIINVKNKDNECLKWALRAALFPVKKDAQRPSKYPVNDGIDYRGIDFPTPINQISKLEKQNPKLAINVFGWENNLVIIHRISKKEKKVPRINLMLLESGEIQHYCYVKRVSALLYNQTKHKSKKNFCMMCLTNFTKPYLLEEHERYCNGVNGRPTRIELPKKG